MHKKLISVLCDYLDGRDGKSGRAVSEGGTIQEPTGLQSTGSQRVRGSQRGLKSLRTQLSIEHAADSLRCTDSRNRHSIVKQLCYNKEARIKREGSRRGKPE